MTEKLYLDSLPRIPYLFSIYTLNWTETPWWFLKITCLCHVFKKFLFPHWSFLTCSRPWKYYVKYSKEIFHSLKFKQYIFLGWKFKPSVGTMVSCEECTFYTCTLENSCFNFLYVLHETKQTTFSLCVLFLKFWKVGTKWPW